MPRLTGPQNQPPWDARELERALAALEAAETPLFAAGRYREFFAQAHALRQRFRTARLIPEERTRLWQRLNRCTEAAKERQAHDFAARNAANLARWREQATVAEGYAANLTREIAELAGRGGTAVDRARWQRRIAENQARLASVRANLKELRR